MPQIAFFHVSKDKVVVKDSSLLEYLSFALTVTSPQGACPESPEICPLSSIDICPLSSVDNKLVYLFDETA